MRVGLGSVQAAIVEVCVRLFCMNESNEALATVPTAEGRGGWMRLMPWIVAMVAVVIATVVRLRMNMHGTFPAGMDAGYYPLQSRFLLESGSLYLSDLPIFFWLNAGLAKVFLLTTSLGLEDALILASRLLDSVLQPWTGVAVVLCGAAWMRREGQSPARTLLLIAPALLTVLCTPILRMVGDFQKQSLGLVFVAMMVWSMSHALTNPQRWRGWIQPMVWLILAGLTHSGTFGAGIVCAGAVLACFAADLALAGRLRLRTVLVSILGGIILAAGSIGAMYVLGGQNKANAILSAPAKLFTDPVWQSMRGASDGPMGGAPGMFAPPGGGGPPGMGGPGGGSTLALVLATHIASVVIIASMLITRAGPRHQPARFAICCGCALSAMAVCSPLLNSEYFERISIMTPVPMAVALAGWISLRTGLIGLASRVAAVVVAGMLAIGGMKSGEQHVPGRSLMDEDKVAELREMKRFVPEAERTRTLVVARHGLEFWAGLTFGTFARQQLITRAQAQNFDRVLLIIETRGGEGMGRGMGPPGGGPGMGGPPGMMGGPPPRFDDDRDDATGPGRGPGRDQARGRVIYEGDWFSIIELDKDQLPEAVQTRGRGGPSGNRRQELRERGERNEPR